MTKLKEAQNFIKKNGIDSDEYVSKNIKYFMSGGDPDDNSISLYNEHQEMLKIIIEAGLKVGQIEPQVSLAASSSGAKSEPTFGKWIECKMELPESGDTVLCCNTMGEVHEAEFWRKGKTTKWNFTAPYYGQDLEHEFRLIYKWMPLPKP